MNDGPEIREALPDRLDNISFVSLVFLLIFAPTCGAWDPLESVSLKFKILSIICLIFHLLFQGMVFYASMVRLGLIQPKKSTSVLYLILMFIPCLNVVFYEINMMFLSTRGYARAKRKKWIYVAISLYGTMAYGVFVIFNDFLDVSILITFYIPFVAAIIFRDLRIIYFFVLSIIFLINLVMEIFLFNGFGSSPILFMYFMTLFFWLYEFRRRCNTRLVPRQTLVYVNG